MWRNRDPDALVPVAERQLDASANRARRIMANLVVGPFVESLPVASTTQQVEVPLDLECSGEGRFGGELELHGQGAGHSLAR